MWPEAMAAALRRWRDANTEFELGAVAKHHVLYQLAALSDLLRDISHQTAGLQ